MPAAPLARPVPSSTPAAAVLPAPTSSLGPAAASLGPAAALVGLVLAVLVVFVWKIGGVILVLAPGHGVHSGDLLALPLALPALGQLLRWLATAPR